VVTALDLFRKHFAEHAHLTGFDPELPVANDRSR
jgi:hypothetical protein